jgi:succinate dehydrogenase flavin-adding protein (antitoxin of CptAB toxin-antitoxin module)
MFISIFKRFCIKDVNILKKSLYWRLRNLGQLEVELIIMNWYKNNENSFKENDLKEFYDEMNQIETNEMNDYFIKLKNVPNNKKYSIKIQNDLKNKF